RPTTDRAELVGATPEVATVSVDRADEPAGGRVQVDRSDAGRARDRERPWRRERRSGQAGRGIERETAAGAELDADRVVGERSEPEDLQAAEAPCPRDAAGANVARGRAATAVDDDQTVAVDEQETWIIADLA